MEPAKRIGRFGRSCRVCKLYFVTSDPSAYTCPWCAKAETKGTLADVVYQDDSLMIDNQMLVQEEV